MNGCRVGRAARIILLASLACVFAGRLAAEEPFNVRLLGEFPRPGDVIHIVGNYAYIGSGYLVQQGILRVFDVSDPTSPVLMGDIILHDVILGIQVRDGLAYLANGGGGLRIVDVTNPTSPTLRGSYDTPGFAMGISVSGNLAFVADDYSLQIIDVSNPTSPTLRGSCDTPGYACGVFVSGGMAYIADYYSLEIVDVTNPSSPVLQSSYGNGGEIYDVSVSNGVAYVTATFGNQLTRCSFDAVDVTNPASPRLLGAYGPVAGAGGGICVSNGYAYVSLDGFRIFDVRDPSTPTVRGFYPTWGWSVFVCGNLVYVSENYSNPPLILQFTGRPAQAGSSWNLYR